MPSGLSLRLSLPVPEHFAEDHGVGEVAGGEVHVRKKLLIQGGKEVLDIRLIQTAPLRMMTVPATVPLVR